MHDLVSKLGLESRMLNRISYDEIERVLGTDMDCKALSSRIKAMREESERYLINAIEGVYAK